MTAFDSVWALIKADMDFITTTSPEEIARKRAWLYGHHLTPDDNYTWPSDEEGWKPEGQKAIAELLEEFGEYDSLGQANTFGGYEQIPTWRGTRDGDAIIDAKGRALLNLPRIYDYLMGEEKRKFREQNPRPELYMNHPDYIDVDRIFELDWDDPKRKEYEEINEELRLKYMKDKFRYDQARKRIDVDDEDLINEIIRVINHEVGHTTQGQEEKDWKDKYTRRGSIYDKDNPISDFQREIFMLESLASIYEEPHDKNWRKRIAEYGGMGMQDYHDKMRELSYGMAKFFEENPDVYRSKEKVLADEKELEELIERVNRNRAERGEEPI
tara:strand:+ start:5249 stop:6229 length:981 start_codon:yes stop_codon:yes gene_type:complete